MRVLITRPREDAETLAGLLRERNIEPVIEPMLVIHLLEGAGMDLDGVQALLLTSANGARALAGRELGAAGTDWRDIPVFAVGSVTAKAARDRGFRRVVQADGDVDSLGKLVAESLDPRRGALLHVAGSEVAGDLAGRLRRSGFTVRRAVLYEAAAAESLSPGLVSMLKAGAIELALFFSPRTAESFVSLARKAGVAPACKSMTALCLSAAVAEAAKAIDWADIRVAGRPELEGLLTLIDGVCGNPAARGGRQAR